MVGRPLLMLACRHHIQEIHLKHFWLQVTIEKTSGPDNSMFKAFKEKWSDFKTSEDTELSRFDWERHEGTWLETQATEARNQLRIMVHSGAFRNAKVLSNCN